MVKGADHDTMCLPCFASFYEPCCSPMKVAVMNGCPGRALMKDSMMHAASSRTDSLIELMAPLIEGDGYTPTRLSAVS